MTPASAGTTGEQDSTVGHSADDPRERGDDTGGMQGALMFLG